MTVLDTGVLAQDTPNAAILDAVRGVASTDYQRRIPDATTAGVAQTIEALTNAANRQWYNEFIDVLVNRIGMTIARNNSWTNPLAPFKRGLLSFGNTIEEIQVGLLQAHNYDPDRDYMEGTLFGRERPEVQVNFHTVNRQNFYKVTINDVLLKRAFLDPNGLAGFINQLMEAPTTSDQWDEFLLTSSLFAQYESNGGFFHVNVPDVANDESTGDDARRALRRMRSTAGNLKFLSTQYNAARMPVAAQPEDLLLFVTPEFNAAIDVEALAGAFNIEKAQMHGKIVELPDTAFGINGCQAIMTTADFFVIADTLFESTNQWNPANLHNNYFLHHHEVISCSRFVPAVMFTTQGGTEVITVSSPATSVSAITIEAINGVVPTNVATDGAIQLIANAVTTPAGGATAVVWSVTGSSNPRTFISQAGVLHVAYDETATTLHVFATSASVDPDNPRKDPVQATLDVTVVNGPVHLWPEVGGGLLAVSLLGVPVAGVVPGTFTYAPTIPTGSTLKVSDVDAETMGNADTDITVTKVGTTGYTVVVKVDNGVGAQVTYTFNVTFA